MTYTIELFVPGSPPDALEAFEGALAAAGWNDTSMFESSGTYNVMFTSDAALALGDLVALTVNGSLVPGYADGVVIISLASP